MTFGTTLVKKGVLWRVVKRLSYIGDVRCLKVKRCISWIWYRMRAVRTSTATTLTDVFVSFLIVSRQMPRCTTVLRYAEWDSDCIVTSIIHKSTSGVRCGSSTMVNITQRSHIEQAWTNKRVRIYMFGVHPFRKRWYRIASKQYHPAVIKEKCDRKWTHQYRYRYSSIPITITSLSTHLSLTAETNVTKVA
jgi:hypothetical protein